MSEIVAEVRIEFHIPPYFEDSALMRYATEGEDYLLRLNPGRSIDADNIYRMLLKNYIYYAYHGKVNEYKINYAESILNWQLTTEVTV